MLIKDDILNKVDLINLGNTFNLISQGNDKVLNIFFNLLKDMSEERLALIHLWMTKPLSYMSVDSCLFLFYFILI